MSGAVPRMHALRQGAEPKALSAEQIQKFDRDGFLLPLYGISAAEASEARGHIEAGEREKNTSGNTLFNNGHLLHRWQYELATLPHILDMVEDLIGPNFYIWKCQLWIKEQNSPSWIGWHQDSKYWGLDPPDCVNVWMALTDVTPAHGPMEFYAGSHAEPLLASSDDYKPDNMLTRGQVIPFLEDPKTRDNSRVVPAILRPGEFSLHHLGTAHGGSPNRGDDRRIGFNVTYCAASVHNVYPDGRYGMPVRGCADPAMLSHMRIDQPPALETPSADNIAAHAAKAKGLAITIMSDADMEAFKRVSAERAGRNLPPHVTVVPGAAGTSLASLIVDDAEKETAPAAGSKL